MLNSFFLNLRSFGILRIFNSIDFLSSIFVLIILERITIEQKLSIDLNPCLNILVGLFSFVFAALAIMVVFANGGSKIGHMLQRAGSYGGILFQYWYACIVYLVAILYVGGCIVFQLGYRPLLLGALWITVYSIFVTFSVVKVTVSLAIYDNESRKQNDKGD